MQTAINFHAPNLMTVCVDAADAREIGGRLYATGWPAPRPFSGSSALLLEMDSYLDTSGLPQAATRSRSFRGGSKAEPAQRPEPEERKEVGLDMNNEAVKKGEKGTFIVQVQYRQNATWQGSVHWAEKNVTQQFRSALELLKLIDSALDAGEQ